MLMSIQKVLYYLQYFYVFLLWKICARMTCFDSNRALDRWHSEQSAFLVVLSFFCLDGLVEIG
jgi:hypothetical protein